MKKKLVICLAMIIAIFCSTSLAYAEINVPEEEYVELTIPIFNSVEEAQAAIAEQSISYVTPLEYGDEGGTQYCRIYPYLTRVGFYGSDTCDLSLEYISDFPINSIRFKKLVVESDFWGINYYKLTPESGSSYCVYDVGSLYRGRKRLTIDNDDLIYIPFEETQVRVKTSGLQVFHNTSEDWIACQYQIGGKWLIGKSYLEGETA